MSAPFVRLGRIIRPHGNAGEVTIQIEHGLDPDRLLGLTAWIVPPPEGGARGRRIASVRPGPRGTLLSLEGITGPESARALNGRWLLGRADAVSLVRSSESDLRGYEVIDRERGSLGQVARVIVTGANDVLVVEGGPFGQVLVPVIDDVVIAIDQAGRSVSVALLEGLIEEGTA